MIEDDEGRGDGAYSLFKVAGYPKEIGGDDDTDHQWAKKRKRGPGWFGKESQLSAARSYAFHAMLFLLLRSLQPPLERLRHLGTLFIREM
jgi:hypothetical protein